jgi:crotonobetaine/carnitine-CoA ligase
MSHHYWYDIWSEAVRYARYTEDDVLYTGLPFFHGNAQGITIGPAILADAKAVIVERFSASQLWDDCRRYQCTEANYIGGIIPILLKQPPRSDDADNPVRLMVGAAAPADEWHAFQKRFNTKLLEVYGMTECYCCLASPYDAPRAGSCGQAITGWDVRIVDEDDNDCPPDTNGEFIARSNKMWVSTSGYYKKPDATWSCSRTAGSTRATSVAATPTATSASSIARSRRSGGGARTSLHSRSNPSSDRIRPFSSPASSAYRRVGRKRGQGRGRAQEGSR